MGEQEIYMPHFDKTIQLFIFNGDPAGRIMCELSNWNGRVYKVSRNQLSEFSKRPDSSYTGIYFLFGKDESNNETVYIGEAENIINRLKQHIGDSVYWNECVVVVSKDNILNKAHVKYLENKFYRLAKEADRAIVINSTTPTCSSVSEYDRAMLEEFIDNSKLLVNTLGYKAFEVPITEERKTTNFYIKAARGANAVGTIIPDGFVVFKGSLVASSLTPSTSDSFRKFREKLFSAGVIDESFVFTKDYVFSSPSYAAAIVMGRNANGKTEWKTENRKTLSEIEADL